MIPIDASDSDIDYYVMHLVDNLLQLIGRTNRIIKYDNGKLYIDENVSQEFDVEDYIERLKRELCSSSKNKDETKAFIDSVLVW